MRNKALFLGSVSLAAMTAAVVAVQAQDAVDNGYKVSVEGGALFGPNDLAGDKLGGELIGIPLSSSGGTITSDQHDNMGWRAAVAVQRQIDPLWDMKFALALNQQLETTNSLSFGATDISSSGDGSSISGLFESKTDFDYETMDFEAGYSPEVDGPVNVRLFGGVRGLHYNDTYDKVGTVDGTEYSGGVVVDGSGTSGGYSFLQSGSFYGVGPRIGAEASTRLGDSMFGLTGSVAGSFILGRAQNNVNFEYDFSSGASGSPVPTGDISSEEWGWVTDFEASLGVDFYVTDTNKLTIGGRVEKVTTLSDFSSEVFSSGSSGGDTNGRLTFGPTVKFEGAF